MVKCTVVPLNLVQFSAEESYKHRLPSTVQSGQGQCPWHYSQHLKGEKEVH